MQIKPQLKRPAIRGVYAHVVRMPNWRLMTDVVARRASGWGAESS